MGQIKKLEKKFAKLEKKIESACPVDRKRLMRSAVATEKRIALLRG